MLTAIALIPSAPVLVPELAGDATAEVANLRDAVIAAAWALPERWIAVGVGAADEVIGPDVSGTLAGYGVDVPVNLSPDGGRLGDLPLCALIVGWVRGQVRPRARAEVRVVPADSDADSAMRIGRRLRAEVDEAAELIGVLIVADGAHTLTPAAPGGHDPESVAVQAALDDALARGDVSELEALPDAITGRAAWQVLAGMTQAAPRCVKELYRGAPYGVGYFAGVWQP